MSEFDTSSAESAPEPVVEPVALTQEDADEMTLRVTTFGVHEFVGYVDGAGYSVTAHGSKVASAAADSLIEQALAVGITIEKG